MAAASGVWARVHFKIVTIKANCTRPTTSNGHRKPTSYEISPAVQK